MTKLISELPSGTPAATHPLEFQDLDDTTDDPTNGTSKKVNASHFATAAQLAGKVDLAGDTMTGDLRLPNIRIGDTSGPPTQRVHIIEAGNPIVLIESTDANGFSQFRLVNASHSWRHQINGTGGAYSLQNSSNAGAVMIEQGAAGQQDQLYLKADATTGIRTNSPTESLDINGTLRIRSIGTAAAANALGVTATGVLTTNVASGGSGPVVETLEGWETVRASGTSITFEPGLGTVKNSGGTRAYGESTSAITKLISANFAEGNNQGGLDTGTVQANETYHYHAIYRSDTQVTDFLFSLSPDSPTLPSNYDYSRPIGAMYTVGSAFPAYIQDGDRFDLSVPVNDVSASNPGSAGVLRTLSVPTGIIVDAIIAVNCVDTGGAGRNLLITSPAQADTSPTGFLFSMRVLGDATSSGNVNAVVATNTSGQVRTRFDTSAAALTLRMTTHGWLYKREQ